MFDFLEGDLGLASPFFANRPSEVGPFPGFEATAQNSMDPMLMQMMGMNPNFGNFVQAPSHQGLNAADQSALPMYGMEYQQGLMNTPPPAPEADNSGFFGTWFTNPGSGTRRWSPYEGEEFYAWLRDYRDEDQAMQGGN